MDKDSYALLDSGNGQKLERFGPYILARPAPAAIWEKSLPENRWQEADATFSRDGNERWSMKSKLPESWNITCEEITFKISPTDFGHLGIFPEQKPFWKWMKEILSSHRKEPPLQVLNLFAYSGGATLACAKAGASIVHLDASKGMTLWARQNAALSGLEHAPIRWIVDDAKKFCRRESTRKHYYDAIILDPPSFGRGAKGEVFKIERDLLPLLYSCRELLSEKPLFVLLSCHTPGFSPKVMENIMKQLFGSFGGTIDAGEMTIEDGIPLPAGTFARWGTRV
jgi:23S rRNA (cytosine1962-C5)-methyltransferase